MELTVIQGNIADQRADAIVTAAGTSLMMDTSGTGTALLQEAGPELGEAAVEQGPIPMGEVAVTDAYGLDAEYVIHAAAAHFGGDASAESIRSATERAIATADELGCRTIVLPAIGCGIAGFDITEGGAIIVGVIQAYEPESLRSATVIGYTDEEYGALSRIAREQST